MENSGFHRPKSRLDRQHTEEAGAPEPIYFPVSPTHSVEGQRSAQRRLYFAQVRNQSNKQRGDVKHSVGKNNSTGLGKRETRVSRTHVDEIERLTKDFLDLHHSDHNAKTQADDAAIDHARRCVIETYQHQVESLQGCEQMQHNAAARVASLDKCTNVLRKKAFENFMRTRDDQMHY
jgi:hypothetical protein